MRRPCPCVRRLRPCEHLFGVDDVMMFAIPYPMVDRPRPLPVFYPPVAGSRPSVRGMFLVAATVAALLAMGGAEGPNR